jgi:hypothetical protein
LDDESDRKLSQVKENLLVEKRERIGKPMHRKSNIRAGSISIPFPLFAIVLSKPDGNCTSSIGGSRAP